MSQHKFTESHVEEAALEWLQDLGYGFLHGPDIAPGGLSQERETYSSPLLPNNLRQALFRLNPTIPASAIEEAFRKLTVPDRPTLVSQNHSFHKNLVEGVPVEYQRPDGSIAGDLVKVMEYDAAKLDTNEFFVVNQFTITENNNERRPDIVLFVNGLPLAVMELKNAADDKADIWKAFNQIDTYKSQIPCLFQFNEGIVISDGTTARIGTLTSDKERFMPWRTIEGESLAVGKSELQIVIEGAFDRKRFLDRVRYFTVFEDSGDGVLIKKQAGYHQFHAVQVAVEETIRASADTALATRDLRSGYGSERQKEGKPGDKRVGVVWHTQGSGKSLTMAFYAGRVVLAPEMHNPTIVVITDRNDLDDQLFGTFASCHEILRQAPQQAENREHLKELLKVASGGVVFTTVHKFFPAKGQTSQELLSDRRNIVVIADEAHRSQYDFIDGFARHMRDALPGASFIGFTGTPIETADSNTRAVFGDYISVYDIARAVEDGATVPILYESRLAKLALKEEEKPKLDNEFEEVTEGEEAESKERLKTKWAALEALVGSDKRVDLIAQDLVHHYEQRLEAMDGKAMVVCMSRRICVELYNAIVKIRPDWHHEDDDKGLVKIVMTGSASDIKEWQPHIRGKARREELAKLYKDPKTPFKLVIVRDMWLTGFDAPCMHTMYLDKPMKGHGLMQAIARVNRVFRDKPGGLVVDYLGLADSLRQAVGTYTESGGKGDAKVDQEEAVALMLEKYEVCCQMFHGFDWSSWATGTASVKLTLLPNAQEHVLAQEKGKDRFTKAVTDLSRAFALAVPHESAIEVRDDVGFFQAVRAVLTKTEDTNGKKTADQIDFAIRQIVSRAVASDEVVDIFAAAGLKKPDISVLSEEFLAEVQQMPQKNLAIEMLRKLLEGEIKQRGKRNAVQARSFAELLQKAILKYQNRAIENAQVITELLELAKDMREADRRGEELGLTTEELAFYDALETNDSAVKILGDEKLCEIAHDLVRAVKNNVGIDWTLRESVRANMRVIIKRILKKHGYPPDKQAQATKTVLEQAELILGQAA